MKKLGSFLFQGYFVTAMLVIPYFNWQYAKHEGFASWMVLGQIVPTYQAMVWPYYALTSDSSEEHYRNSFTVTREVLLEIDRHGGVALVPKSVLPTIIERIDYAVQEAEKVGDGYLQKWHPSFGEEWRNGYTASLRELSSGMKSGDGWKQVAAVIKYNNFSDWASKAMN